MMSGASVIKQVRRYNWMISPASKTTSRAQFRISPACNSQKCHKNSEQTSVINNFCAALHTRKLIRAEAAEKKINEHILLEFYLFINHRETPRRVLAEFSPRDPRKEVPSSSGARSQKEKDEKRKGE